MTKRPKKTIRYSTCFKQAVIQSIEEDGLTIGEAKLRYGIGGAHTIQNWLRKYGKNHLLNKVVRVETMDEIDELKRLKAENEALKLAYAELSLQHKYSESVIEVADKMFNLDLKKKYAEKLSKHTGEKKP